MENFEFYKSSSILSNTQKKTTKQFHLKYGWLFFIANKQQVYLHSSSSSHNQIANYQIELIGSDYLYGALNLWNYWTLRSVDKHLNMSRKSRELLFFFRFFHLIFNFEISNLNILHLCWIFFWYLLSYK